jgi:hypothetical protein
MATRQELIDAIDLAITEVALIDDNGLNTAEEVRQRLVTTLSRVRELLDNIQITPEIVALLAAKVSVGSNNSQLINDELFIKSGQVQKTDIIGFNDSDYATAAQGIKADTAIQSGAGLSVFTNDAGYAFFNQIPTNNNQLLNGAGFITSAAVPTDNAQLLNGAGYINLAQVPASDVNSVNGKTGTVTLSPDDLDDTSSAKKFVTANDLTKLGNTTNTNSGDESTASIQTKRPIKTIGGESLEGTGNIDLPASGVTSVTGDGVDNTDPEAPVISYPTAADIGAPDLATVEAIAAGSSLGVEQALLANDGQPGFTVQAVGYTNTGKVQGCSLGAGNVVEVYADGNDFNAGNVLYREFMALGEPICFTGLTNGAIITASEGFYGFSECLDGSNESPMPLLSYGLSFKFSFFFMFRDSQSFDPGGNGASQGWIHVVNGPLASVVSLKFGDESVVEGQENISLAPWQYYRFYSSGNAEYILDSTNPIMACVNARMGPAPRFYDSRLVMPLSNAIFSWPRSGNVSAPYEGTIAPWYNRTGTSGELNSAGTVGNGPGVSPGFPVDWDSPPPVGTGASDQDYEANGFTGQYFVGLGCAYSGADSAGLEASPAIPKAAMSQIVAQPLYIKDNGDGGNSGVAIGSYYEGTAKIYAWDFATKTLNLAYTVPLTRGDTVPVITSKEDQLIPAAGLVANETGSGAILLEGDLAAGIVIADVPITVVTQNGDNAYAQPIRSQNGTETTSLINDDDETLSLGITPESIRVEVREGEDGILYKRTIAAGGIETWVVA